MNLPMPVFKHLIQTLRNPYLWQFHFEAASLIGVTFIPGSDIVHNGFIFGCMDFVLNWHFILPHLEYWGATQFSHMRKMIFLLCGAVKSACDVLQRISLMTSQVNRHVQFYMNCDFTRKITILNKIKQMISGNIAERHSDGTFQFRRPMLIVFWA